MSKIQPIKKEIIELQQARLLPGEFQIIKFKNESGREIRKRLRQESFNLNLNNINYIHRLNILSRLTIRLRPNTIKFWEELLKIAVDSIPDWKIEFLPSNCVIAIKYAVQSKRLKRNFQQKEPLQLFLILKELEQ